MRRKRTLKPLAERAKAKNLKIRCRVCSTIMLIQEQTSREGMGTVTILKCPNCHGASA